MGALYWTLAGLQAFGLLVSIADPAWLRETAKKDKTPASRVIGFVIGSTSLFALVYAALVVSR